MKKEKDLFVAVLIDGDNASSEKMEDVMRFVSRYGTAVVRRIYGCLLYTSDAADE